MMSDFEIRANNISTAISVARQRVKDFGYDDDSSEASESRVVGMFITWLTASEEARQQAVNSNASFKKSVIDVLPLQDDINWDSYLSANTTLRQRAEALWGIRVAFTHGDGNIDLITNTTNRAYVLNAPNVFSNIKIENNTLVLTNSIFHQAIRTMVQIRDVITV